MTHPSARLEVDCQTAVPELAALVDGELSPRMAQAVRRHVAACPACAAALARFESLRQAVAARRPRPEAGDALRDRIRRELDEACRAPRPADD